MRYMILILGLAIFSVSCSKTDITREVGGGGNTSLAATSYLDVAYGSDAQQTMDVYLPAQRTDKTRLLVIIHGGGWTAGDKSDYTPYIQEFQKRLPGYAFVNLNYRLVTEKTNHFPAQEKDLISAVEFLKSKTGDYSISNEFVFLGISAGAHLALLQGYKHSDILQPKGIISYFGPVDLQEL
jgi:acetyl esterase/lipase